MSEEPSIPEDAIILNALEDDGGLLVHIPRDHRLAYRIDGELYNPTRAANVRVAGRGSITAFRSHRVLVNYVGTEDGVDPLSVDEYMSQERELCKARTYVEGVDEYKWSSLDDEFAHRRFTAKYRAVHVQRHTEVPVELGVKLHPKSPSEHIRVVTQFGPGISSWCVYAQKAAILAALDREIARHSLVKKDTNADLGAGELKVYSFRDNEVMVYGSSFRRSWECGSPRGPLGDILPRLRADEESVSEAMAFYANLHGEPFTGPTCGAVAEELRRLASTANGLELKKKSWGKGRALARSLIGLAKKVEAPTAKEQA